MLKATATSLVNGESLDLDEISREGAGVEAVAGMTGLGLPPVDVQWFEGAGDGARPRSVRVLPRDVDLPLWVGVADRAALKAKLRAIARVFASGSVRITLTDTNDGEQVYADFIRVGGGTFSYGIDTTGETDWESIITLRAGDPYWRHGESVGPIAVAGIGGETVTRDIALENPGTAEAWATWEIDGPCSRFEIDGVAWTGNINLGETVTVDTEAGTVIDQAGENRYDGLGPAPHFPPIPAGNSTAHITLDSPAESVRFNYAINPQFRLPHDWTASPPEQVAQSGQELQIGAFNTDSPYDSTTTAHAQRAFTVPPSSGGRTIQLRVKVRRATPPGGGTTNEWNNLLVPMLRAVVTTT